jgi:transposase
MDERSAPKTTIGLDVGDKYTQLCVLDDAGEVAEEGRVRTTETALVGRFSAMAAARVVLEAGTHAAWMRRALLACGHEVLIADSYQMGKVYRGRDKSDRRDAETLARFGRTDPKMLHPVHQRSEPTLTDRAVLRSRGLLVRMRAQLIHHMRGLTKTFGARLPQCSAESFASHVRGRIPERLVPAFAPLLDTLALLTKQIRAYDRELERIAAEHYPETERLRAVNGVGLITAISFVLGIEDPHRFRKSRDVGAFLGLRPRQWQSGDREKELGTPRVGDRELRRVLVQSAHYILGPFGKDSDLRRFGERLKKRGGRRATVRAVVAVARKLAVLLHRLWVSPAPYDPLYLAHRTPATA